MYQSPANAARKVNRNTPGPKTTSIILTLFLIGALLGACNMPTANNANGGGNGNGNGNGAQQANDPSLENTRAALSVQATMQAQQAQRDADATAMAADATRIASEVQATMLAQQATELAGQATQIAQQATQQAQAQAEAQQPTPTQQPAPTDPPPAEAQPTEPEPTAAPDYEAMMKEAKILLFEDMAGLYEVRYIRNALDTMGLRYTDVGDAIGNFKAQLLSGTDWDLIIAGSESHDAVQGEYFTYLLDEINRGAAVIIEVWNLDAIVGGKFSSIMAKCGLQFQADWWEPKSPSLWWLAPEEPVFHEPNEGMSLVNYIGYWSGDAGDLIRLAPGSESTMLAGNIATERQRYGTLASCEGGRVIIQTYCSHDYHQDDVERLWANYIYNTLKVHFEQEH